MARSSGPPNVRFPTRDQILRLPGRGLGDFAPLGAEDGWTVDGGSFFQFDAECDEDRSSGSAPPARTGEPAPRPERSAARGRDGCGLNVPMPLRLAPSVRHTRRGPEWIQCDVISATSVEQETRQARDDSPAVRCGGWSKTTCATTPVRWARPVRVGARMGLSFLIGKALLLLELIKRLSLAAVDALARLADRLKERLQGASSRSRDAADQGAES
jgi:hypothetical protein